MSDEKITLCVTSGRGPVECRQAVAHVLARMKDEAQAMGLSIAIDADGAPPASAIVALGGAGAASYAQGWLGSALWICESKARPGHKRKNWFVAVAPLQTPPAPAALEARDVVFEAIHAGGPGGQHQNKTLSAVRATHKPTGLVAVARGERSQSRNKAQALERLAALLATRADRAANSRAFGEWLQRIAVARGDAKRVFTGDDFKERRT
jgi:peptide chain release factor